MQAQTKVMNGPHKYQFTNKELDFLRDNFSSMTNKELATALGHTLTLIRMQCYSMGLKRMELEYWTDEQIAFLLANYKTTGDKELAEIFNKNWIKEKGWTHKHIEKKRRYLKLKRTPEQIQEIHRRNVDNGRFTMCPVKAWQKRGITPDGEIRYWKKGNASGDFPVIKINGKWHHWSRWKWESEKGQVPEGSNVVFIDRNNRNLAIENLKLLTNAELSRWNSEVAGAGLSDNYIAGILSHNDPEIRKEIKKSPKLLDLKRKQLLLNRSINGQSNKKESKGS